jgi:hypothetical protein
MDQLLELVEKLLNGSMLALASVAAPFFIGVICAVLVRHLRKENKDFCDSILIEGVIIDIVDHVNSLYPIIEYNKEGESVQFTSRLATLNGRIGDNVTVEVSPSGRARIESNENIHHEKLMPLFGMFSFMLSGVFFYIHYY